MDNIRVSQVGVYKLFCGLRLFKVIGFDEILVYIFKEVVDYILLYLIIIYQKFLDIGVIFDDW